MLRPTAFKLSMRFHAFGRCCNAVKGAEELLEINRADTT
jgi:hypothetical protein